MITTGSAARARSPSPLPSGSESLEAQDARLARLGRFEARDRLRLGELLDALFTSGGHHELGFSSEHAYVLERSGHKTRWAEDARRLARRLQQRGLHEIRRAIITGQITFTMAELLARKASADTEAELLAEAKGKRFSEMRRSLCAPSEASEPEALEPEAPEPRHVRLRRNVGRGEVLMLHASRPLVELINGRAASDEALLSALLGEAVTTLSAIEQKRGFINVPALPSTTLFRLESEHALELESARDPKPTPKPEPPRLELIEDPPLPTDALSLDAEIVRASRALAERQLEMGRLARGLLARGWAQLGYRSASDYARERVGVSLSTLEHRITLARRAERHPELEAALVSGAIGCASVLLIGQVLDRVRFAEPSLVRAWIDRARRRTVVHLREEVNAVLILRDLDRSAPLRPPTDEALEEVAELERQAQTGDIFRSLLGAHHASPQMFVTLHSGHGHELRLRVSEDLALYMLEVENRFRKVGGPSASFISFMCFSLWHAWLPYLDAYQDKWKHIYLRERHRCSSPVCDRRDVTPHHLMFQSHGGGHQDENLGAPCAWCHLDGVHGGRLKVAPPASNMHWLIGRTPILEVRGRDKRVLHRED